VNGIGGVIEVMTQWHAQ